MRWRSLEFHMAAWSAALLFGGLLFFGAALWWGVSHSMVAALDELLVQRSARLNAFVDTEFGTNITEENEGSSKEFTGILEHIDVPGQTLKITGRGVHWGPETVFATETGQFEAASLRPGQPLEVAIEKLNGGWEAALVSLAPALREVLQEELSEYVIAVPEGSLIQIRDPHGSSLLTSGGETSDGDSLPWIEPPNDGPTFQTIQMHGGAYRILCERATLAGMPFQLTVASSLRAVAVTRDRVRSWLLWAIPVGLLISFAGGYLVSSSALHPVENMAAGTARIHMGNLSERLEVPRTGGATEQLAETINAMLARLESSVRKLDRFTADASHEMRTPVSIIRTTAELALRQERREDDLRRDMEEIHDQSVQLTNLIEDLLTLARADGGAETLVKTEVDLGELITSVCEQMTPRAASNSVQLRVETQPCPLSVDGHELSLRRLLVILVDNALEHTPPQGSIVVVGTREDSTVQVSVEDSGEGIPEEELEKVFDRFYRVDPARSRASGGFGLGLSIAKWIVESHGGHITATNLVGKGSAFTVGLPASAQHRFNSA